MTSGKTARRKRRQAVAPPPVRSKGSGAPRRANPKVIAAIAGLIVCAVVPAAIVLAVTHHKSSSSTNNTSTLPQAAAARSTFDGIPQNGNVLGSAKAPATMVEYIDLQCPVCREFETTVMPSVVPRFVKRGKLKVIARPIAILGPDSEVARKAAIVAMRNNVFFQFAQILYFNQGQENSGWVTDQFVADAFASIPGQDVNGDMNARNSTAVSSLERRFDGESQADHVLGTPTVLIGKSGGKLTEVAPGGSPTLAQVTAAVDRAAG